MGIEFDGYVDLGPSKKEGRAPRIKCLSKKKQDELYSDYYARYLAFKEVGGREADICYLRLTVIEINFGMNVKRIGRLRSAYHKKLAALNEYLTKYCPVVG